MVILRLLQERLIAVLRALQRGQTQTRQLGPHTTVLVDKEVCTPHTPWGYRAHDRGAGNIIPPILSPKQLAKRSEHHKPAAKVGCRLLGKRGRLRPAAWSDKRERQQKRGRGRTESPSTSTRLCSIAACLCSHLDKFKQHLSQADTVSYLSKWFSRSISSTLLLRLRPASTSSRSFFMDVKCPGCFTITTVFSHAQTVVVCAGCSTVLCQPTGGKARLTEGCSFRRK